MRIANPLRLLSSRGRTSRLNFLLFTAGLVVAALAGHIAIWMLGAAGTPLHVLGWAAAGFWLLWIWAAVALLIRRLHDVGATWRALAVFAIVVVGGCWLIALAGVPAIAAGLSGAIVALVAFGYLAAEAPTGAPPRGRIDQREGAAVANDLRDRMQAMALPTLLMKPATGPVFSKLGGKPDLPASMDWPSGHECARLFVAQLDLTEVRAAGGPEWLAATGRLYFFYDEDATDALDLVACYGSDEPPGPERSAPQGYEPDPMFNERRVDLELLTSLPSLDWLGVFDTSALPDAHFDELNDAPDRPFGDGPQHRIGGYPSEIQSTQMAWECEFRSTGTRPNYVDVPATVAEGAKDWRLLLQVDSDDDLGMNWVDSGRLYVFIRERDARAGDFSKTATIIQFY